MDYKQKIEEKRQKIVDTLIGFIEANPTEWEAGWYKAPSVSPFNGKTQKKYNGLNAFYLCVLGVIRGYSDPRWVTFNQAKELGANVRADEKSSDVFYWSYYDKATKQPYNVKTCEGMTKDERKQYWDANVRPVIKFYQVFNAEQCENMPEYVQETTTPEMEADERRRQNTVIEQIISNSEAPVSYDGGNRAYYSSSKDSIHLPEIKDFKTMQDYYATALHEIAHSTGHESRLKRNMVGLFGTPAYAKEELRAELASVFMQVEFGLSVEGKHFENHGAYLASWLKSVKDNKNEFFAAVSDAEKITSYVADNYVHEQEREPIFEENASFAKQVDAVLSGADTTSTHLKVMGTPLILRQLGAQNLPVLMTAKHLRNIVAESGNDNGVNYHNIDPDIIKRLPELLSDPVMIMDSMTKPDSVVFVALAVDKENRPIIGAIKFDGYGYLNDVEIDANILTSTYGRNNFNEFIKRNIDADTILYWDKEKSQELIKIPGLQLPDNLNSLATNISIRKAKAFVNSLDSKNEKKSANVAENAEVKQNVVVLDKKNLTERENNARIEKISTLKNQLTDGIIDEKTYWEKYEEIDKEYGIIQNADTYHSPFKVIKDNKIGEKGDNMEEKTEKGLGAASSIERRSVSPLYADYLKMQEENPNAIVLARLGGFYEVMGDKAKAVAEQFDLTLTGRDVGLSDRVPTCSFPANFLGDYYISKIRERSDVVVEGEDGKQRKKPLVINFYAGPGAGKTTAALELTAALKKGGINVEYVSEYAKDLVLEGKTELLSDQQHVTDEQYHRLDRLRNSVNVIVTDSPVLLGIVYGGERIDDEYRRRLRSYYESFNNLDFLVERQAEYQTEGRLETEQQAKVLDTSILQMLQQQHINCLTYTNNVVRGTVELVRQVQYAERLISLNADETADFLREREIGGVRMFIREGLREIKWLNGKTEGFSEEDIPDIVADLKGWFEDSKYNEFKNEGQAFDHWYDLYAEDTIEPYLYMIASKSDTEAEQADTVEQVEQFQEVEQSQQAMPAEQVDTVEQVRQVGQAKWNKITLDVSLIGAERGKSTQLKMPDGEYSSFVFFAPTKFIQRDEKSGAVQLSVNEDFKYTLMYGNQRVELTGSELRRAMAGQEVGRKAQRVLSEANAQTLADINRNVPQEMRQNPNWCVYTTRWNEEKGKKDKQIFSPVLGLTEGGKMQWASIDKPETWASFAAAMKFAEENDCAGLVYALDGNGISCIDLDKSVVKSGKLNDKPTDRSEGELSTLAARLSDELNDTYIETSASGNGIHIFVKDDLLANGKFKNRAETPDGDVEVYDDRRFMSMTGNIRSTTQRLGKSPVATTAWLQEKLGEKATVNQNMIPPRQAKQIDTSDSAVVERIRRSKKGVEFEALYRGDNVTGNNSCNDFKLLNMLAFFTDCNVFQMERIFKSSGLYRQGKDAYLQHSISKACETLTTRMSDCAFFGGGKNKGEGRGNSK